MLYTYHNAHMYMRRLSIYTNQCMSIYIHMRSFFTHINAYMFETMMMLPLKYIHHILIYLWVSFYQVNVFYSYVLHNNHAPKIPLRKCPLHSKFLGSLQSPHSVS